jgi:hypothetical protein
LTFIWHCNNYHKYFKKKGSLFIKIRLYSFTVVKYDLSSLPFVSNKL